MPQMRAKMRLAKIETFEGFVQNNLTFHAVGASTYPENGSDENNTFAKFTPNAQLTMTVMNPDLVGKYKEGEDYYVDFTPAS